MTYRVTNSMMQQLLLNDMHTNLNKLIDVQQQLSTQRKYQYASENPNAVTKGMNIETMMVETEQYKDNLLDAVSWLKFTDSALGQMTDVFQRIRELAIYGGDGVLEGVDLQAIGVELSELKKQMVSLANSTIAGEYLFAGLLTEHTPFTVGENGDVVYNGNDYSVKWEFSRKEVGKVSITGSELFPKSETTHYLTGVEVPLDFAWTGRSEILEFKVGWQTVKVRIPERWTDENVNGLDDYGDYNRFRDIDELEGWSLSEIAELINKSTEMGDVSKLLKAEVVTDTTRGVQKLVIKAHTGENVRLTSWPETDPEDIPQGIKGAAYGDVGRVAGADGAITIKFDDGFTYDISVAKGETLETIVGKLNGLPDGRVWAAYKVNNTVDKKESWIDIVSRNPGGYFYIETTGGAAGLFAPQIVEKASVKEGADQVVRSTFGEITTHGDGAITIDVDGRRYTASVDAGSDMGAIVDAINKAEWTDPETGNVQTLEADEGVKASTDSGVLTITRTGTPDDKFGIAVTGGLVPLLDDGVSVKSSVTADSAGMYTTETYPIAREAADGKAGASVLNGAGALYVRFEDGTVRSVADITDGMTLAQVAEKIAATAGIDSAEVIDSVDANGVATQYIRIKSAQQIKLSGYGSAAQVVGATHTGSAQIYTNTDHTHIGFAEFMGMETAIKSAEFQGNAMLGNTNPNTQPQPGQPLHIKFVGAENSGEVYIADSTDLSLEDLAKRINGVCGTWLQAVVETDEPDGTRPILDPLDNSEDNRELATKRLVLRTVDGQAFAVYDGAGYGQGVGHYAEMLGISTALMGVSTAAAPADTQDWNVKYPEKGATDSFFDENMPAIVQVKVGTRLFECKVCNNNCPTAEKVAAAIVRQVNEQYGGTLLAWDANDVPNVGDTKTFALFAVTGEPLSVIDKGYGDPRYTEFSGGVAMQLGIAAGVTSVASDAITDKTDNFGPGMIRVSTSGHSVDIPVVAGDTLQTLSVRIREYAGDWLDVAFYDSTIGPTADGGLVRMSLAAKDGSAVSVLDLDFAGNKADPGQNNTAHRLGIDTGLSGTKDLSGGIAGRFPTFSEGDTLTFTVNGAVHTIDLWDREIGDPVAESVEDLAREINTRFQGKDIVAEVYEKSTGEKYLMLTSPWGYAFDVSSTGQVDVNGTMTDVKVALFGDDNFTTRGFAPNDKTSAGDKTGANYNQIVTRRTGDNVKKSDFFGVMDNLIDCVEGGNVDGISDVMIEQLDNWMNTLLKCRAQVGALQQRYQSASYRMTSNNTNYTELWTNTVGVDLAEVITNYQMASNVYEASLAALARIIQPTLLNFLS